MMRVHHATHLFPIHFLCPGETSENLMLFRYFHGVKKECIGKKWVNVTKVIVGAKFKKWVRSKWLEASVTHFWNSQSARDRKKYCSILFQTDGHISWRYDILTISRRWILTKCRNFCVWVDWRKLLKLKYFYVTDGVILQAGLPILEQGACYPGFRM